MTNSNANNDNVDKAQASAENADDAVSLQSLTEDALAHITKTKKLDALNDVRVAWLGKKGHINAQMKRMAALSDEEKREFGQRVNVAKQQIQNAIAQQQDALTNEAIDKQVKRERLDVTMPGRRSTVGTRHPVSLAKEEAVEFFRAAGFTLAQGPEIEDDFHNFEALNIPQNHPARSMQDTFYVETESDAPYVLRTHTSNVEIHTLKTVGAPIKIVAPGRVYRSDSDMTHTPMFHQIEGMWIDESVSLAQLKDLLTRFVMHFFDNENLHVRFRPSFFPFTEPSAEMDIGYPDVDGTVKWLEILGCGMTHPNVLRNCGIDADKYQGFAFGMGIERIAMLRYGISDLRILFDNDLRYFAPFVRG